jgi:hypothetical protein
LQPAASASLAVPSPSTPPSRSFPPATAGAHGPADRIPEGEGERSVAPLIVGGVVGAVAIGVGIGLLAASNGKANEAKTLDASLPPNACGTGRGVYGAQCDELDELASSQSSLRVGGGVAIGAGALAAATGVVWWLLSEGDKGRTTGGALRPRAEVFVGPRGSAVAVRSSF